MGSKLVRDYVSELMRLGIDMPTIIDIERQVAARCEFREFMVPFSIKDPYGTDWMRSRIIAVTYGPQVEDWDVWFSNPFDEWAGEFWDMIDHPERAMPGAWEYEVEADDYYYL